MRGKSTPVAAGPVVVRSQDPVELFDKLGVKTTTPYVSDPIEVGPYREAALLLFIDSTGSPTTLHVEVEFLDRWSGQWYTLKQGPFAALYYEDTGTASGIYEAIEFPVVGRTMRLKLTGVGTTGSAYFTVSAAIEPWA